MVAVEIVVPGQGHEPDAVLTKELIGASAAEGLIILSCGTYGNVIRFLPALTIDDETLDEGLERFGHALAATNS
jgi:4-aminobutyrate aminotransferase/(S)-3-amino-2-methylpropionate transaminase